MPLYTYSCSCGDEIEIVHSITEDPEIACGICDEPMKRKIGNIGGVRFKGNGFYSTDQGGRGRS